MKSLKQQGIEAFVWDFVGKLAKRGMGFVVTIILARLLQPEDFGSIAIVMIVIEVAALFVNIGLSGALIQRRHVLDIHYSSVFYFSLCISTLLTAIIFVVSPWIASFYNQEILEYLLKTLSVLFIIGSLTSVQATKFRKELNYKVLTGTGLITSAVGGGVGVVMALNGAGVWSLVASSFVGQSLYGIVIWTKSSWKPSLNFSFKALRQLWGFGFRMFLSLIIDTIFIRIDYLIIGKLFPLATVGFLQRAKSLNELAVHYSSGSLMAILFPLLSKVKNDLERFQKIIIKSLNIIVFVAFFLLGSLYLSAESLIVLLFGEKWLPSVVYFEIIALGSFARPISPLLLSILSSRGNSKAFLRLEVYKKLLMSTDFIVLYYFGVMNYLYYRIATQLGTVYMNIVFASNEVKLTKLTFIKPIFIQGCIAVVSVLIIYYFNHGRQMAHLGLLTVQTIEYGLLYVGMNIVFKTDSNRYIMNELKPHFNKVLMKIR